MLCGWEEGFETFGGCVLRPDVVGSLHVVSPWSVQLLFVVEKIGRPATGGGTMGRQCVWSSGDVAGHTGRSDDRGGEVGKAMHRDLVEAYHAFDDIDVLDLSKDGSELWRTAVKSYEVRVERTERSVVGTLRERACQGTSHLTHAASLKDRLQSAAEQGKGSTALVFREFARFNGLLSRERAQDSFGIAQVESFAVHVPCLLCNMCAPFVQFKQNLVRRVTEDIAALHVRCAPRALRGASVYSA